MELEARIADLDWYEDIVRHVTLPEEMKQQPLDDAPCVSMAAGDMENMREMESALTQPQVGHACFSPSNAQIR